MRMIIAAVIVFIADMITKQMAIAWLKPRPWPRVQVIPGFFDFFWAENTGGAFSLFHSYPLLITLFSSAAIVLIAIWARKVSKGIPSAEIAFGMILGGAIGNLVDRIRFQYVVDFIHWYVRHNGREYAWPTFNIADCGIVIGIGIFLYLSFFTKKLEPKKAEPEPATAIADESIPADKPDQTAVPQ